MFEVRQCGGHLGELRVQRIINPRRVCGVIGLVHLMPVPLPFVEGGMSGMNRVLRLRAVGEDVDINAQMSLMQAHDQNTCHFDDLLPLLRGGFGV